jgi:oxygen-independent coproporphyrinogen-3 oxidase
MTTLTQTVRPLPNLREEEQDTRPGNYFVSNYPPFSLWKPENVPEAIEAIDTPPDPNAPLGIYVHLPFCRKRCHFCYFKVYTGFNAKQIQRYLDAVNAELDMYDGRAFIGDRKPGFVYFGGGTPSFLSIKQLTQLTDKMKQVLPWDEVEEVTFECEPGTLNEKKVQALRDIGITRLSLGVENFNDHILRTNNRAHESKQIYQAYEWAQNAGFPQINIDLIAGMLEETEENWIECVREAIRLQPDCVTIYQMEIPFNTTIYKQMQDEGRLTAPVADWETKRRWAKYAFEEMENHGYTVSSGYTAVKDTEATQFAYRDNLWTGADLVAVGVSSFGHVNHTHYQNEKHIEPYMQRVESGELPIHRALRIDNEEALIRQLVLQMKLGKLKRSYFQDKFGVDILEYFAEPFRMYREAGFISVNGDWIELDRDALLQVDEMLHEFLLPEHRGVRYT